jgi:predicted transcriptional regulator of viral defense system
MQAFRTGYRPAEAARFIDDLQSRGYCGFALDHLTEQTGLSRRAAAAQLGRLSPSVIPLYARATYYLIVPPEHRRIGAPPVSWWIDDYFAWLREPYYIALLTAAAHHGASHQAAQVVQAITGRPRRDVILGRQKLCFVMKRSITATATETAKGGQAPFRVSTPEATVLDLIRYGDHAGGIDRIAHIISELRPRLSGAGLRHALDASLETTLLQRTGFLLDQLGMNRLSRHVASALQGRRLQPTSLEARAAPSGQYDHRWRIYGSIKASDA